MSGYRSPLDAYRDDLTRTPGKKRLAAGDEFWIILATGLRRLSQAPVRSRGAAARRLANGIKSLASGLDRTSSKRAIPGSARSPGPDDSGRPLSVAAALAHYLDPAHAGELVKQVRGAAADAEEAGAVMLAREILTDLQSLTAHAPALERGILLIQLGRIARTLGNLDCAHDLFRAAGDLGRESGLPELEAREAAAEAVLARTRGNYPSARELFERALDGATALNLPDVLGIAHQGLMIVTAEAGDFDAALHHGWHALSAARAEGAREAETLCNLAHLSAKAGYHTAALGGFSAALARTVAPRVRLPALAGIADAIGQLGDRIRLYQVDEAVAREATDAFPFETANAWLAVARAHHATGNSVAGEAAAARAAAIAHKHGYFEIAHRLEDARPKRQVALTGVALDVIRSLEAWSEDPSVELAVSRSTG